MRSGLTGSLMSADGKTMMPVLYSLDGHASRGRLRPVDPDACFPDWVDQGAHLKLYAYDSVLMPIAIVLVKARRADRKNDDHFAEFVVRAVTH
jgi:hypothetical protein